MSDDAQGNGDRRKVRSQRPRALIEGQAQDVTPSDTQAQASDPAPMTAAPEPDPQAAEAMRIIGEGVENKFDSQPEQPLPAPEAAPSAAAPETMPQDAPPPEPEAPVAPSVMPPPPLKAPSVKAPMAVAALVGGLIGTAGGVVVPGFLGLGKAPDATAELQRLRQQITALEARPAPAAPAAPDLAALNQRIVAAIADSEKKQTERMASLETAIAAAAARPATPGAAPAVDLTPLTSRLNALEDGLKAVGTATAAATPKLEALTGQVAEASRKAGAVEPAVAAITARVEQTSRRVEIAAAAPMFALTQGLAQAFERGAPFSTELAAVEALGARPEWTAGLKAFAEKGAPTAEMIARAFKPLAHGAATVGLPEEGGAMAFLRTIVKIRPSGEVGGADQPSLVRTMEAALAKGAVGDALAVWARLPEPARKATADWAAGAEAREKARKALAELQQAVVTQLRTAKP